MRKKKESLVCENMFSTNPYGHPFILFFWYLSKLLYEKYISTNAHVDQYKYSVFSDGKTARWVSP